MYKNILFFYQLGQISRPIYARTYIRAHDPNGLGSLILCLTKSTDSIVPQTDFYEQSCAEL